MNIEKMEDLNYYSDYCNMPGNFGWYDIQPGDALVAAPAPPTPKPKSGKVLQDEIFQQIFA